MDANTWLVWKIWATSFWEPSYIESHKIYIPCRSCDSTCMFHFFSGWISSLSQNYWHTALCRQRSSEHIQIARRRSCYGISTSVLLLMGDSSAYYLRNMFFVLVEILRLPSYHRSSLGAYSTCWQIVSHQTDGTQECSLSLGTWVTQGSCFLRYFHIPEQIRDENWSYADIWDQWFPEMCKHVTRSQIP